MMVTGGGMVFTFLKARGLKTGSSLVEDDKVPARMEIHFSVHPIDHTVIVSAILLQYCMHALQCTLI